jgi:bifunctional DNA-binding transcriptional regulator/antitoxin component of YhaV-PrlF toxin-antitoxin module
MTTAIKRRRGYTHLSGRNQVTIPLEIVTARGWRPGQAFRVELRDGDLVLLPEEDILERRKRVLAETKGRFAGMYEPGYLDKLRDEWG